VELSSLNINLLVSLDALLKERSVSRAAVRMGVTQSAMSHTLKNIRELLEDPLLVRSGNRMVLSPFAVEIQHRLTRGLGELESIVSGRAAFEPRSVDDTFTIATHDAVAAMIAPDLYRALSSAAPQAKLRLVPLEVSHFAEQLLEGEVDAALTSPPVSIDGLNSLPTPGLSNFRVICREEHPKVKQRLTARQYAALEHIMPSLSGEGGSFIDHLLEREGLSRSIKVRVPFMGAEIELVAGTDLIATVPSVLASFAEERWAVRSVPLPLPVPSGSLLVCWHPRFDADPPNQWLRGLIIDRMRVVAERYGLLE
jgi:DNA-binding transcriptional LysR family regulator